MSDHNPLPGTGAIADSVEFVKKLWGIPSAGALPGMLIPTLSLDEINKKIADLKAVESWMAVNMNMLRGTIQALEVQSATIVNLQSMGAMLGSQHADPQGASAAGTGFPFSFPAWPPAAPQQAKPEASEPPSPPPPPEPAAVAQPEPEPPIAARSTAPAAGESDASAQSVNAAITSNANAWWDLLQNQFKQAVGAALTPNSANTSAPSPARKPAGAKPAATKSAPAKLAASDASRKAAAKKPPVRTKAKSPAAKNARKG